MSVSLTISGMDKWLKVTDPKRFQQVVGSNAQGAK